MRQLFEPSSYLQRFDEPNADTKHSADDVAVDHLAIVHHQPHHHPSTISTHWQPIVQYAEHLHRPSTSRTRVVVRLVRVVRPLPSPGSTLLRHAQVLWAAEEGACRRLSTAPDGGKHRYTVYTRSPWRYVDRCAFIPTLTLPIADQTLDRTLRPAVLVWLPLLVIDSVSPLPSSLSGISIGYAIPKNKKIQPGMTPNDTVVTTRRALPQGRG